MKQVVILSGKGGTGKTTLSSMLAYEIFEDTAMRKPVYIDADVDASNLELILSPQLIKKENFSGGKIAVFDPANCIGCQKCVRLCRFDAITKGPESKMDIQIDTVSCEGCSLCAAACPKGAITMGNAINGEWYHSHSRFGDLFHAILYPGEENSGKLVTKICQEASNHSSEEESDLILIDGPPGIGCPVIAAITGVDLAVIVTEPTVSGVHDFERIYKTVDHFRTPVLVIINKIGFNKKMVEKIKSFCKDFNLPIIAELPFEKQLTYAIINGKTIQEIDSSNEINVTINQIWSKIKSKLFNEHSQEEEI